MGRKQQELQDGIYTGSKRDVYIQTQIAWAEMKSTGEESRSSLSAELVNAYTDLNLPWFHTANGAHATVLD